MTILNDDQVSKLQQFAKAYLSSRNAASLGSELGRGASAAVFGFSDKGGKKALKVYDPTFFENANGQIELRRIDLQKKLINHRCENLVQMHEVQFNGTTCFIEMENVEGHDLNKTLQSVPRCEIEPLIQQLVTAVKFLEEQNIVHRDIKPQNIKVSSDFKKLKLLDLGVIRDISISGGLDATEQGVKKPFIATAQYSSPEYLFWLQEPSADLWRGLSIYQVGAVLHDLLKRVPIFSDEIASENRYTLARAVLQKIPSTHVDDAPQRWCALASRCLTKDLQRRLAMVSWKDFFDSPDKLQKIVRRFGQLRDSGIPPLEQAAGKQARVVGQNQLMDSVVDKFIAQVRESLSLQQLEKVTDNNVRSVIVKLPNTPFHLDFIVVFTWSEVSTDETAAVLSTSRIRPSDVDFFAAQAKKDICTLTESTVNEVVAVLHDRLLDCISDALDQIQATQGDIKTTLSLE